MDWWLASFFLGAILSLFLPIVPDIFTLFLLLSLSITFWWLKSTRLSSGLLFGMSWVLFNAFFFQNTWLKNNLDTSVTAHKTQWLQGQVLSLQTLTEQASGNMKKDLVEHKRLRFNFNVSHINDQKLLASIQLRLSWNNPSLTLQQGQIAQLKVKFKPAHGLANLGSFSYQTWLNSNNISATGYVINDKNNKLLASSSTVRQQLFNRYQQILPSHELTPLLLALGFGSRSELNQKLWQVLQATGTGHLIAISGLHIGLVASGSYFFIMLIIRGLPRSVFGSYNGFQVLNIRYVAIGASLFIAFSYGYLAGFSLPTVRALLMLCLYWSTRLLAIKLSVKRWLLITLFLLTVTTPFSLFTASFWLSVYAVTIIFLALWRFKSFISTGNKLFRFIKGLMVIQISLTFMLLPISAIFFQKISLISLFANIIAVPWMSFVSIPLCLLSVLLIPISENLANFCILLCIESIQIVWRYLSYLSNQSWALISLTNFDVQLLVILGVLANFYLFFQPKFTLSLKQGTSIIIGVGLVIGTTSFSHLNEQKHLPITKQSTGKVTGHKSWQLVVFDVGQGLSILIQHQGKAILYDTGASYRSGFNMVDAVVAPYLRYAGIKHLDKVILSHSDNDHAGGLIRLQQSISIDELVYNTEQYDHATTCIQGKNLAWQGLTLEMLWPEKPLGKENDDSCVVLISDGNHKVLLTGDISAKVEAKLIQQYPQLRVDILVVPHHGSKTSSSNAFIKQLQPKLAIVSAGFLNRWYMPVKDVIKRYDEHNIELVNSAEAGQIIINFSESGFIKQTYHDDLWPFWFAKPL